MGYLLLGLRPPRARTIYRVRYRLAFALFITAVLYQQHMFFVSRESLRAKYIATNFDSTARDLHTRFWRPDIQDLQFQTELLANRQDWKALGQGWEGKAFIYQDSVIKTYNTVRCPFRNCAPANYPTARWPTEIPASLRFGGSVLSNASRADDDWATKGNYKGFLPIKAHFMASASPDSPEEWHLVTPLVKGGSLLTLASKLSTDAQPRSYRELDALYRPAFNLLLENLSVFHSSGYCHDDMKPSNIFVQDESHWLLGDLGNVREVHHPYHSSRIWKDSRQIADCRANDVVRTLQAYLKFIQISMPNQDAFNAALLEGREPLSRLLWWTLSDAPSISAAELRQRSIVEHPEATPEPNTRNRYPLPSRAYALARFLSDRGVTKLAINYTLWTTLTEARARLWGFVWLLDLPAMQSCEA